MKKYLFPTVIIGQLIIIVFLWWSSETKLPTETPHNPQDSITIVRLNNVLALQSDTIDSLKTSKSKVKVIKETVTVYVDSLTFAQTVETCIEVFDSVVLVPREKDTLFGFTEKQVKKAIATDTVLKLTQKELTIADSIIVTQGNQIDTLQVKVNVIQKQSDKWQNGFNNAQEAYSKERKWKMFWRGANPVSFLIGVLVGRK